jgi:hypothetical protein
MNSPDLIGESGYEEFKIIPQPTVDSFIFSFCSAGRRNIKANGE